MYFAFKFGFQQYDYYEYYRPDQIKGKYLLLEAKYFIHIYFLPFILLVHFTEFKQEQQSAHFHFRLVSMSTSEDFSFPLKKALVSLGIIVSDHMQWKGQQEQPRIQGTAGNH